MSPIRVARTKPSPHSTRRPRRFGPRALPLLAVTAALASTGCRFLAPKTAQVKSESGSNPGGLANPCALSANADGTFASKRAIDSGKDVWEKRIAFPTELHRSAWLFACHSQEFNTGNIRANGGMVRPLAESYPLENGLIGMLPYWDLPENHPGLKVVSVAPGSWKGTTVDGGGGKVRIYAHYLDTDAVSAVGTYAGAKPTGTVPAVISSSFRTILILPKDGVPAFVKLNGDGIEKNPLAPEGEVKRLSWDKYLANEEIDIDVYRAKRFGANDAFIVDGAGVIVSGLQRNLRVESPAEFTDERRTTYNQLYRPFPLGVQGPLAARKGDVVLAAHSLLSDEFYKTDLGRSLVGDTREKRLAWYREKFLPALADSLIAAVWEDGLNAEMHGQNVDVLLSENGDVRKVFIKDVADASDDPMVNLMHGRKGEALFPRKFSAVEYMHWANHAPKYEEAYLPVCSDMWYYTYLGDLTLSVLTDFTGISELPQLNEMLGHAVFDSIGRYAQAKGWDQSALDLIPEYQALKKSKGYTAGEVGRWSRETFLKYHIKKAVVPGDPTQHRAKVQAGIEARKAFAGGSKVGVCSKRMVSTAGLDLATLRYGTVNGQTIGYTLNDAGAISDYVLIIEQDRK